MKLGSEDKARRLVLSVLPKTEVRQRCLTVFAEAIDEANRCGRDKWAVTHTKDKVRLVVGHIRIFTLRDRPKHGPIWMALDKGLLATSNHKSLLERSEDWEWDVDQYPEYPTIQARNGYYSPSENHSEIWPTIRRLHFESIGRAVNQTTMDPRTFKGHSPELLSCIGKELGRQLPEPLYLIPNEDKGQPDKSVTPDAGPPPRGRPTLRRVDGSGRGGEGPHWVEERRRQIDALLHREAVKDEINYMSGEQFEDFMADLFRQKGYSVQTTIASGDQGVDLILEVEGRKVAVQLKRWAAPVGNRVISHTLGGMLHYGAQEAWVITTSSFTPKAKEMARSTGVRLIDGKELAAWLEALSEEE